MIRKKKDNYSVYADFGVSGNEYRYKTDDSMCPTRERGCAENPIFPKAGGALLTAAVSLYPSVCFTYGTKGVMICDPRFGKSVTLLYRPYRCLGRLSVNTVLLRYGHGIVFRGQYAKEQLQ